MITREEFYVEYVRGTKRRIEEILKYQVAVPAALDRPCDYETCQGWHMLRQNVFEKRDVDNGFISPELLDWLEGRLP